MMKFLVMDDDNRIVSVENSAERAREVAGNQFDGRVIDLTGGSDAMSGGSAGEQPRANPWVKGVYRPGTEGPYSQPVGPYGEARPSEVAQARRLGQIPASERLSANQMILDPGDLERSQALSPMMLKKAGLPQVSLEEVFEMTRGFRFWDDVCDRLLPILLGTQLGDIIASGRPRPSQVMTAMLGTNYKMSKGAKNRAKCPSCSTKNNPVWTRRAQVPEQTRELRPGEPPVEAGRCPKCGVVSRLGVVRGLVLTPYWFGIAALDRMERQFPDKQPGELCGSKEKNTRGLGQVLYPIIEEAGRPGAGFYSGLFDRSQFTDWQRPVLDPDGNPVIQPVLDARGRVSGYAPQTIPWDRKASLCLNSSAACRASCLVLTGQQLTNFGVKLALTKALLEQPVAFYALLAMACRSFFSESSDKDPNRFLRLNVLSDIPHELTFPALWDIIGENARIYDYSKCSPVDRQEFLPDNYDITFSFNGTNWSECEANLRAGYRVAVVFVQADPALGHSPQTRLPVGLKGLPTTFKGWPVIDGDGDDMRPLDRPGCIVALRYKKPKKVDPKIEEAVRYRSGFVVPVLEMDGQYVAAESPLHTGGRAINDVLSDDPAGREDTGYTSPTDDAGLIFEQLLAQYPEYGGPAAAVEYGKRGRAMPRKESKARLAEAERSLQEYEARENRRGR